MYIYDCMNNLRFHTIQSIIVNDATSLDKIIHEVFVMKDLLNLLTFLMLCMAVFPSWAVKIYECEDEQGNRTFESHCPPWTKSVNEKQYSTGSTTTQNKQNLAVTLYIVPDCETCDQVKEFLAIRNISITEKNANESAELQKELREKTGGELHVPTLLIGETVLIGYERNRLLKALTDAGYSEEE